MDVLPAIPDPEGAQHAIKLTDRDLTLWQASNPIAFANWFRGVMVEELWVLKEAAAEALSLNVQDVPDDEIKTTLQRAVQALKRHRDIHFAGEFKLAPASVIITTLAAQSYTGGGSLYDVLMDVTRRMPSQVERINGRYVVENPVCGNENFADRWHKHPEKADAFFAWIDQAAVDFGRFGHAEGADVLLESVRKTLGDVPARAAEAQIGAQLRNRRSNGLLTVGATGVLGAAGRRNVPDHTFHGDAPAT
jgi:hypothetical protein